MFKFVAAVIFALFACAAAKPGIGLASHAGNQGEEGDGEELEHLGGLGCFDLLANETDDNCWMNTPFYTQPDHPQLALALKLSGNTFLGPPFN